MNKGKNFLISSILLLIGAICFAIVTYGHFYRGENNQGVLCLMATVLDLISCILNYNNYKKIK